MINRTTSEFLSFIENVIKIDSSDKKTSADTIFNLWKGFCDFYSSNLVENESTVGDYLLIEEIHNIIDHSYRQDVEKYLTLSEIQSLLMDYRRLQFNKRNNIVSECKACKIGVITMMCCKCHKRY